MKIFYRVNVYTKYSITKLLETQQKQKAISFYKYRLIRPSIGIANLQKFFIKCFATKLFTSNAKHIHGFQLQLRSRS